MSDAPLRADAEERRRRILAAAHEIFAEQGLDVPMERIARAACVGVGTLYRRFPDRTALAIAVVEENLGQLISSTRAELARSASAWEVLAGFLNHPRQVLTMRPQLALAPEIARAVREDAGLRALQSELYALIAEVVDAARAEGSLRPDVGPADVALLFAAIRRPVAVRDGIDEVASDRLRALVLDALAAGPRSPLPHEPLGVDALATFGSR